VKTSGGCTSGAGGMIWLAAESISVTGTLNAPRGLGGPEGGVTNQYGGDGADGRVLLSSPVLDVSGSVLPGPTTIADGPDCGSSD
jgi:hypothetical protein